MGSAGPAAAGAVRPGGGTILDAIGNTPLVMLDGIWAKLEFLNPSGSIKARIARYVIERAEREGLLRPGDTIVEASSGNTGNAMSMVAAVKGYRMLVVMPNGMSGERLAISRAFGAQVVTLGDFHAGLDVPRPRTADAILKNNQNVTLGRMSPTNGVVAVLTGRIASYRRRKPQQTEH
jgi:cysteine synthase